MRVSKWGNSLAIRLPASVVEALDLKEGDIIEIHAAGNRTFEIGKAPGAREILARVAPWSRLAGAALAASALVQPQRCPRVHPQSQAV